MLHLLYIDARPMGQHMWLSGSERHRPAWMMGILRPVRTEHALLHLHWRMRHSKTVWLLSGGVRKIIKRILSNNWRSDFSVSHELHLWAHHHRVHTLYSTCALASAKQNPLASCRGVRYERLNYNRGKFSLFQQFSDVKHLQSRMPLSSRHCLLGLPVTIVCNRPMISNKTTVTKNVDVTEVARPWTYFHLEWVEMNLQTIFLPVVRRPSSWRTKHVNGESLDNHTTQQKCIDSHDHLVAHICLNAGKCSS